MMPFRSPCFSSSDAAVFSPMPGTPGRPSEASPRMVAKSAYWLGSTRYLPTTTSSVTRSWLPPPPGMGSTPTPAPRAPPPAGGREAPPPPPGACAELEEVAVTGHHVDRHRRSGREGADHV